MSNQMPGDDGEIEKLYLTFKEDFLRNTRKYNLDRETRVDIYQDAFIALYESLATKQFKIEKGIKNYLFGIGRNMILDRLKGEKRDRTFLTSLKLNHDASESSAKPEGLNQMEERLHQALQKLSTSCREILVLFYYRNYSVEAIMHSMKHSNENVTKSHKSRCLRQLKEIVRDDQKIAR